SNDSCESNNANDCARTVDSAHEPPTNPSIVTSAKMIASSPGFADVGRSASTTRAWTNGTRCARSSPARAAVSLLIEALGGERPASSDGQVGPHDRIALDRAPAHGRCQWHLGMTQLQRIE